MPLPRRRFLFAAACAACAPTALRAATAPDALATVPAPTLTPAEQERHRILMLLAMALTHDEWGINPERPDLLRDYAAAAPGRSFRPYVGHNIGALLVDAAGGIVGFQRNRNVQLNSTLEHAEARAVRIAIADANARRRRAGLRLNDYATLLRGHRVYTTLEPCAQCAGIMTLATLDAVVFPQDDPGQHHVAAILYNLNDGLGPRRGPAPLRAAFMPQAAALADAYAAFAAAAPPGGRTGLTSFLETVAAWRIFGTAVQDLATMQPEDPANRQNLAAARAFRNRPRL